MIRLVSALAALLVLFATPAAALAPPAGVVTWAVHVPLVLSMPGRELAC